MCGAMDRVDFNAGRNVEARLLESKGQATGPREQVDPDRTVFGRLDIAPGLWR